MANKSKKTTKPTGLGIDLNAKKFVLSWRIGDKNYKGGQQLYYVVNTTSVSGTGKKQKKKNASTKKYLGSGTNKADIGTSVTSKVTPVFNWDNYFPKKNNVFLNGVSFYVRGKANNKQWSDWSNKTFDVQTPPAPSVAVEMQYANQVRFAWANSRELKPTEIRSYWQYQTGVSANGKDSVTWGAIQTQTAAYKVIKEDITFSGRNYSYTRRFRVRACGPQGASKWIEKKWVYAYPNTAKNVSAAATKSSDGTSYTVSASWTADNSSTHPIDSVTVEYAIAKPDTTVRTVGDVVKTIMSCPDDPGWSSAGQPYKDNKPNSKKDDKDGLVFSITHGLPSDQCIFVRVNTYHEPNTSNSDAVISSNGYGELPNATLQSVVKEPTTNIATVTAENNSDIAASFLAVYYRTSESPDEQKCIGIIPAGQTTGYFKLPELEAGTASIGVRAIVGDYSPAYSPATGASSNVVDYVTSNVLMQSPQIVWENDAIAAAPTVSLTPTSNPTTVRVAWDWSWLGATEAEISWADHEDAWESTDEPTTYIVNTSKASQWNVSGLSIGTWYFRVRLLRTTNNTTIYGAYSKTEEIKLASSPAIPAPWLSESIIAQNGSTTIYWAYASGDGTNQLQGEICEAEIQNDGTFTYGEVFDQSGTSQHITISAEERGWIPNTPISRYYPTIDTDIEPEKTYYAVTEVSTPSASSLSSYYELSNGSYVLTGDTELVPEKAYYLVSVVQTPIVSDIGNYYELKTTLGPTTYYVAVRVRSASGEQSEGWSVPVPITIANPPTLEVRETSLKEQYVVVDDETHETELQVCLTDLPLNVSAVGAGDSGKMTYIIERADTYVMARPDESRSDGFGGETIAILTDTGENPVSIGADETDLIGSLDDGARYNLIITLEDVYGQTAEQVIPFVVHWDHQAIIPEASIIVDDEARVAMITALPPNRLSKTLDTYIVENKPYVTVSQVSSPVVSDISTYYELVDGVYIPTEDTEIASGKTYYTWTIVDDPTVDHLESYYEFGFPGDSCDIYRLSVDKPELIVSGGLFGVTYVDPHPTLGSFGGHRVVYITKNGDYVTEENINAWSDYTDEEGDIVDVFATIIDFDGESITLPYDIGLSNKWSKDFTETKYLGGSVQGDWNPAVSRTATVTTNVVIFENPETVEAMRRLADYPGVCRVRTPDGSNFSANVNVSESRDEKMVNKIGKFSLEITRVESENYDSMTLAEWLATQEE